MKRFSRQSFSHEEIKRLKESEQLYLLAHLECQVCLHVPRDPSDNKCCEDGHFICNECIGNWKRSSGRNRHVTCPTCNNIWRPSINRFRQQYLERYYLYNPVKCRFEACSTKDLKVNLEGYHENVCVHRLMYCPGAEAYRQGCKWHGSVKDAPKHMRENGCAKICISHKQETLDKIYFSKVVRNEKNYFSEDFVRVFKPIVLLHPAISRGLFWLQIERDDRGYWTLYTMAQLSEESLMNTKASIRVVAPTKKGFAASFKVHSGFSMSRRAVKSSGNFLCFHDSQIRRGINQENAFTFSVILNTDEDFRKNLNDQNNEEGIPHSKNFIDDFSLGINEKHSVPDLLITAEAETFDAPLNPSQERDIERIDELADQAERGNVSRATERVVQVIPVASNPAPEDATAQAASGNSNNDDGPILEENDETDYDEDDEPSYSPRSPSPPLFYDGLHVAQVVRNPLHNASEIRPPAEVAPSAPPAAAAASVADVANDDDDDEDIEIIDVSGDHEEEQMASVVAAAAAVASHNDEEEEGEEDGVPDLDD